MAKKGKENKNLFKRPPVVVVLGHVDHGKSSILEAIKDLKITVKESGGITQHIGAYEVEHSLASSGQTEKITFIDTPGHEAFSAIRARGAKIADIAILVVAAEEGVKPQTKEAILHIKKAGIPFIVALNKIDKQEAQPEKAKRELSTQEVLVESMGGKIPSVEISAKTKKGIPELLEMILLLADMEQLKADITVPAKGVVIESYLDNSRGPTATLVLQEGILKQGDFLGTHSAIGKARILEDFQGKLLKKAYPSQPVIIVGFENAPGVGEQAKVFSDAESAKKEIQEQKKEILQTGKEEPGKKVLNIILKTDVLGSLEAINEILKEIPQEKTSLRILKAQVGEINESDIKTAKSVKAKIIGFRVGANPTAKISASREKITIITFDIIYELSQAIRQLLKKITEPEFIRINMGRVKILEVFKTEKSRQIIGGRVTEGIIKKGVAVEIERDEEIIGKGKIVGLQRQKKDIDEVSKGSECGMLFEGGAKIEKGDNMIAYKEEKQKKEL